MNQPQTFDIDMNEPLNLANTTIEPTRHSLTWLEDMIVSAEVASYTVYR